MSISMTAETRIIRDPAFARRLEQACDTSPHCPLLGKGRLSWIAEQLAKRMKAGKISPQTVARWLAGEVKPRRDKNDKLAEILSVDSMWLYFGVEQDLTPRERKARNAMADGAVNLIAGLIQMDGGYPAFPQEKDTRAQREHVDLYAVIKGANYSFHVSMGTVQGDNWQFVVPVEHENIVVLGVVRQGFSFRVIELTDEIVQANGTASGRSITVTLSDEAGVEGEITSFARRL